MKLPLDLPRDPAGWRNLSDAVEALWREARLPPIRGRASLGFQWDVNEETMDAPSTWKSLARSIGLLVATTSTVGLTMSGGLLRKTAFGEKPKLILKIEEG